MSEPIIEKLANGLTVIIEEVEGVETVAYEMLMPGGLTLEPEGKLGASLILAELTARGAGSLDARAISDAFDRLGARHGESGGMERFDYRGLCLSDEFPEALKLSALQILEPTLPEDEIDSIKSLLLQDIASLPDSPSRRVIHELYKNYFPEPHNRSGMGTVDGIQSVSRADLIALRENFFAPSGSVLSIAGKVKVAETLALVQTIFGSWGGTSPKRASFGKVTPKAKNHISFDAAQLQIALAYPSAPFGHEYYYAAKVASSILSGGMFGRVFIEVREKRGLVYSVSARHSATSDYGMVMAYAGTTPDRAQETLDVLTTELKRLPGTVTAEELVRAKTNIKSALVLGEEATSSRAASNAQDFWVAGRIRPFAEIMDQINAVGADDIEALGKAFPLEGFNLTTLGSRTLETAHLFDS